MNSSWFARAFKYCFVIVVNVAVGLRYALEVMWGVTASIWHGVRDVGVVAYRRIGQLIPVYRESYDTHGLSLAGRRRC